MRRSEDAEGDDTTLSFVYDRQTADAAFAGIVPGSLALSFLAGILPRPEWEGCLVYQGSSPLPGATVCIATRGPGAGDVGLCLVDAYGKKGIRVLEVYDGGPEVGEAIAVLQDGRWSSP